MSEVSEMISYEVLIKIITATAIGTLARVLSIRLDYRQYPNYPNGYMIHVITGATAAALGAFIIPTLMTKNFTAVTFLTLAIQQFRDVRKIERESLLDLEGDEYTVRGGAYIDGIAKIFESRNYIALLVAFATSLAMQLLDSFTETTEFMQVLWSSAAGLLLYVLLKVFTKRHKVRDIATVKQGEIVVKGSELYVDGMLISNTIGEAEAREWFAHEGLAAVIYPNKQHHRIPLENPGQRQAILFEATRRLGKRRYGYQDVNDGKVIIVFVPIIQNFELLKETILLTPLLETVKKSSRLLHSKLTEWEGKR